MEAMWAFLSKLVDRTSPKFVIIALTTAATLLVMWFGGLLFIAVTTKRSVEFLPPKISTDPELVNGIQRLAAIAEEMQKDAVAVRSVLLGEVVSLRREAVSLSASGKDCVLPILQQAQSDWEAYEGKHAERMKAVGTIRESISALEAKL